MAVVYLVEDDPEVGRRVCALMHSSGHEALWFDTPHKFFYQLSKRTPACVLVDWVLPELAGIDVVTRVRQMVGHTVGVLMLTAVDAEDCIVRALAAGADDYVIKPMADAVLVARVEALLRRVAPRSVPARVLELGPYRLDFASQRAWLLGQDVELAPREFDLAWALFAQPARLITKQELLSAVWGKNSDLGHHTIAQHVYSVRKKLELAAHGVRLVAVYASGYRLELPEHWAVVDVGHGSNQPGMVPERPLLESPSAGS
jgi:two-component system, OmpR family, phosphate regulon response regulator PhoB